MKTIKVFLASSSELEEHREKFAVMVLLLNQIYRHKGICLDLEIWEFMSNAMGEMEKQAEYDEKVRESDLFIALFYTTAGKYTQREVKVAYDSFCQNKQPRICIYMYNPKEGVEIDDSLKEFTKEIENRYSYFTDSYSHFDTLKYKFYNQLALLGDDLKLSATFQNGKLYLEGVKFVNLDNILEKFQIQTDLEKEACDEKKLQEAIDKLINKDNLRYDDIGADIYHVIDAKKHLTRYNMCAIPDDFFRFTKYINGVVGDDGCIFGILPNEGYGYEDVIKKNGALDRQDKDSVIVLGENDMDWLVYSASEQKYQMRSKLEDDVIRSFDAFVKALCSMYRI